MGEDNRWLPFWEHFHASDLTVRQAEVVIDLEPDVREPLRCGRCLGHAVPHERVLRRVRDLPMLGYRTTLRVNLYRVRCKDCGECMQQVSWLAPYARLTRRLQHSVAQCCARMPIAHVAELFGVHWTTVRALDGERLVRELDALPEARPVRLMVDEFALFKGHRYATVVLDAQTRRVLYVACGRSRAALRPFFEQLGPQGCARIQAVAMDMNSAFDLEVRAWCPQARIVYDLFHVVAKYGREVISRVRVDAANALRHDKPARRVVKQAHWLLLRNHEGLAERERIRLDEVLAANQSLLAVYVMKETLKALWNAPSAWEWRRRWKSWHAQARESGIDALRAFSQNLQGYWRGILSRVRFRMHTGLLEGINNRIKVIKRMAYGYRDTDFFFLKIKAAFPGNAR